MSVVMAVAPVTAAWLTKVVLDRLVAGGGDRTALLGHTLGLCLAGLVSAVAPHVARYVRAEQGRRVGILARDELFTSVERFVGLAPFEDPAFVDRLRLAQRAGAGSPNGVLDGIVGIAGSALAVAGFFGALAVLNPVMSGVVVAAAVPALLAQLAISRRRAAAMWAIGRPERLEFFYQSLLSTVEAAKEIRLFGTGAVLRQRMLAERRSADTTVRAVDRRELRSQGLLGLVGAAVAGGGLFWAVSAAWSGHMTIGDVSMFVVSVAGVQAALSALVIQVASTHQHLLLFRHHLDVVGSDPEMPVRRPALVAAPLRQGIEVRDVWFRYSDEHPWILRGVSFTIPSGTTVALVGRNGAGKSTLVKLLCRFYDPVRGSILWDGVDIRDLDPPTLRSRIGAVFQDFASYDLSAADNIGLGDVSALGDLRRIESAARTAGVHDVLAALPHRYDTELSRIYTDENDPSAGVVLSGGQWQRVALARAMVRAQCDLLICDEPNSGLDAEAEYEVHETLRRHRDGRTSILISHRLSALRDADRIVVLEGGVVVEEGRHDGLLALSGRYAGLFERQAAGYREQAAESREEALT
ncbi:ABC transporter ATP-binding protein [Asanoa iriomotensis]|uniref:ABC transporter ATP-binding protein n=1 Tax=Asanoa iriomotensis TaxID=234613 RepID=UPI001EF24794|nr:ABC transporter ATP-binding protein [Asanoa iriomotensis]